jgi:hypothetical protein
MYVTRLVVGLARRPPRQPLTWQLFFITISLIEENSTPWWSAAMGDFIACGTATPRLLSAASSSHRGRRPSASVLSESTVGASITYHSTNPIPMILCLTPIISRYGWLHRLWRIVQLCQGDLIEGLFRLPEEMLLMSQLKLIFPKQYVQANDIVILTYMVGWSSTEMSTTT